MFLIFFFFLTIKIFKCSVLTKFFNLQLLQVELDLILNDTLKIVIYRILAA